MMFVLRCICCRKAKAPITLACFCWPEPAEGSKVMSADVRVRGACNPAVDRRPARCTGAHTAVIEGKGLRRSEAIGTAARRQLVPMSSPQVRLQLGTEEQPVQMTKVRE